MIIDKLPIILTAPRADDNIKNQGGGDQKEMDGGITSSILSMFRVQFQNIENMYNTQSKEYPNVPIVGKIIMKEKAIAKSHKPNNLLHDSCPVIGTGKLNELYIKVTKDGIYKIKESLEMPKNKAQKVELSKIERFEEYSSKDKIKLDLDVLDDELIKIKLFDLKDENQNKELEEAFLDLIDKLGLKDNLEKSKVYTSMNIYKLKCQDKNRLIKIANFQGVRTLDFFQQCRLDTPKLQKISKKISSLAQPLDNVEYPIIGLIDSGISMNNKVIAPWIYKKETFVPEEYQNNSHGTFVAGIMLWGKQLNLNTIATPHFKILDVAMIPNSNPNYGKIDVLTEDIFLENLEAVVKKYYKEVKVWNLSLSTNTECEDTISDLAVQIDEIQNKYGVYFIVAAGNYAENIREYPIDENSNYADRITTPADSIKAITVGSIALEDGAVKKNEPSPFSRRGPGANYILKPTMVDYGGNRNIDGSCTNCGIVSFDEEGNLVENIGTSFSTPFVTEKIQNLINNIQNSEKYNLAKALLFHSCTNPITGTYDIEKSDNRYYGLGIPSKDIEDILKCDKDKVTIIYQGEFIPGQHVEMEVPYPKSLLKDGKWLGETLITLFYNPPLDSNEGQEYCRANIDVSMGLHNSKGKYKGQIPPEQNWDEKFEKERVENGAKWNPIKRYYRNISRGITGTDWKLRLDCTARNSMILDKQQFTLVITIKSNNQADDIYTDIKNQLRRKGYVVNNLQLRNEIQNRV